MRASTFITTTYSSVHCAVAAVMAGLGFMEAQLSRRTAVTFVMMVVLATLAAEGSPKQYTLNIAAGETAPDGFKRIACLINGQFPGTLITGNKGERALSTYGWYAAICMKLVIERHY